MGDDVCALPACGQPAARHLSFADARRAFDDLPEKKGNAPLCKVHYKAWKKATKKDRELERLAW